MKQNNDLLREILFEFKAEEDWLIILPEYPGREPEERKKVGHVKLLCDAGPVGQINEGVFRLTSPGYDYLDAIRSDTIWTKTKAGASAVGGVSLGMMKDIALSYVKQELAEKLGIAL